MKRNRRKVDAASALSLLVTFQHCVKKHSFQRCPKNYTCRDQSVILIIDIWLFLKNIQTNVSNKREIERLHLIIKI